MSTEYFCAVADRGAVRFVFRNDTLSSQRRTSFLQRRSLVRTLSYCLALLAVLLAVFSLTKPEHRPPSHRPPPSPLPDDDTVSLYPYRKPQSPTLLFKSGFEPGTILGPVTGTAPNSPEQSISGTDPSTGFTWPITAFSPNPGLDGIHIIPPYTSTDANSSH